MLIGFIVYPKITHAASTTTESFTVIDKGSNEYAPIYDNSLATLLCPGGYNNNSGNGNITGMEIISLPSLSPFTSGSGGWCQSGLPLYDVAPRIITSSMTDGSYFLRLSRTSGGGYATDDYVVSYFDVISHVVYPASAPIVDTTTHFITISPEYGTTTATTSSVGATLYANPQDFPNYGRLHAKFTQDSAFACQNSGAVYDAVYTCSGDNSPSSPIEIDFSTTTLTQIIAGTYNLYQNVTFGGGGKWTGVFTIDQVSDPWYFFGLFNSYNTILSTTTHFTVGQLSPMDIVREAVASSSVAFAQATHSGIGAILASTTASLINACNPFGGFSPGDCLTLTIWPGEQAVSDDFTIIKQTPPWGYVFRVIDLLNTPTSTTTLPSINYSFASTSPMAVMGNIHFDPFGSVAAAGTLINEMHSDQVGAPTIWTIMMPIVNIFVYLVLAFMVIHDLTGIHWGSDKKHDETKD